MDYLILPPNHTPDDASIWRSGHRKGWKIVRGQNNIESYRMNVNPDDRLLYYGNTLHRERLKDVGLQLNANKLDPHWVSDVNQRETFGRVITPLRYKVATGLRGDKPYFVKCVHEKWFKPFVGPLSSIPQQASMPDDWLHVQDVMEFVDEVRLWVLNGKIVSWSYYKKNGKSWNDGPNDGVAFPAEWSYIVVLCMQSRALPRSIVIDVGRVEGPWRREWFAIEANEPWASGIYDSNPDTCLDVIIANQFPG